LIDLSSRRHRKRWAEAAKPQGGSYAIRYARDNGSYRHECPCSFGSFGRTPRAWWHRWPRRDRAGAVWEQVLPTSAARMSEQGHSGRSRSRQLPPVSSRVRRAQRLKQDHWQNAPTVGRVTYVMPKPTAGRCGYAKGKAKQEVDDRCNRLW